MAVAVTFVFLALVQGIQGENSYATMLLLYNKEHAGCKLFEFSPNTDDPDGFTVLKKPRKCVSFP